MNAKNESPPANRPQGRFATALSCIDGRIQTPIARWIKANYRVDYIDTITEPGMDQQLTQDSMADTVRAKIRISIDAHHSQLIVLSGHFDCAANPVSDERHIELIRKGVATISSWNLGVKTVGVWVDSSWNVKVVC